MHVTLLAAVLFPRSTCPHHSFEGFLESLCVRDAGGVEDYQVGGNPLHAPVLVRAQELSDDIALLLTLVAIFAFQAENITTRAFHVVLIAIPILIQVYFNSGLAYGLMKAFRIPYGVAAPGALIGASNFFELAVATAIALYGPDSGAALATVVGVLVEVPIMLSVCRFCVATRGWFEPAAAAPVLGRLPSPEA